MPPVSYVLVARLWAFVFVLVGLAFALIPERAVGGLESLGRSLGLSGTLASPPGTLWHVLALSLMVCVTGLAWQSARRPELAGPYRLLLAAKITSTAGFAFLALGGGSVWLLGAGGDGFVALTLWLARRSGRPALVPGLGRTYLGQAPFYEVWFGKCNLAPGRAFWFRYTVLDGATSEAATWAIAFDEGTILAGRDAFAVEELAPPNVRIRSHGSANGAANGAAGPQVFHSASGHLDGTRASGRARNLEWDLAIADSGRRFLHVPPVLAALGLAKTTYVVPLLDVRFSGEIRVGERTYPVSGAPGMIGHLYGKKSGHSWLWAHCNAFDGAPDVAFEGLTARVKVAGRLSPPLSTFVVFMGDRVYKFASKRGAPVSSDRLARRWFLASDGGSRTDELVQSAHARVRRYPAVVRLTYPVLSGLLEWLAPLLVLGRPRRASSLSDSAFELLQQRLSSHRWPLARSMFLLFRLPLAEMLEAEAAPPPPGPHPLESIIAADPSNAAPTWREGAGTGKGDLDCEVLIVGSGAGGAPLAWALAQKGIRVAVIEAGSLPTPTTSANALERHYLKQGFVVSLADGLIPVMTGQAVGGTTPINSGTCLRPPLDRLEAWDALAGTDFSKGSLDPQLDAIERLLPVTVPDRSLLGVSNRLFEEGLRALGRTGTYVLPRNAPDCESGGRCCFGCHKGAKRSTDRAFLPGAVAQGCTLLVQTRADRIVEHPDHVEVTVIGPEGPRTLRARHLVLAAGAFGTVGLLRRNRLGTAWRKAGRNLRIHPASKVFAHFPQVIDGEKGVPQGPGYYTPEMPRINFEGIFTPAGVASRLMPFAGERQRWWLERYDHVAAYGMSIQDRGTRSPRAVLPSPVPRKSFWARTSKAGTRAPESVRPSSWRAGSGRWSACSRPAAALSNQRSGATPRS